MASVHRINLGDQIRQTLRRRVVEELLGNELGEPKVFEEDRAGCARAHPMLLQTGGHRDDGLRVCLLVWVACAGGKEKRE